MLQLGGCMVGGGDVCCRGACMVGVGECAWWGACMVGVSMRGRGVCGGGRLAGGCT